jgi:site-specific DNA-cytosine methylase
MKRILELFCGTKSVGKVFEDAGYEVISLDYNPKFEATHMEDITSWDYRQYPKGHFDVIWASPDCTTWSIASSGKYRTKANIWGIPDVNLGMAVFGNNMVLRVIEIIQYFKPKAWFIENPRGLLQHFPPLKRFVDEEDGCMNLVYYANYNNWGVPKPTNLWSNLLLWENETMPEMSEDTYVILIRHDGRPQRYYNSFKRSSESRSRIPPDLITRLLRLVPE